MARNPPFNDHSDEHGYTDVVHLLPASFRARDNTHHPPLEDISEFLRQDLSVSRLNHIHNFLWIAGRQLPPRPFSFHVAVQREIILDERADMHLVWDPSRRMHFKPLPRYLLDARFWTTYICPLTTATEAGGDVYLDARGFLASYISLIQHESDFLIAQDHRLVPSDLQWHTWLTLTREALTRGTDTSPAALNPRYTFGELRLSRLNLIYRLCPPNQWQDFIRGYHFEYQTIAEFLHAHLAPLTVATVYLVLALTAMQVGLATEYLRANGAFQGVSWVFAVVSILAPLGVVSVLGGWMGFVFVVNVVNTWRKRNRG
ncbi:uncharacterized protein BJX67DRAFT_379845 [Aspergillus lucknowensis]|uniref:Uncharacterized protein n=1 Tax=Aspergillus lucknowensis TaxID=176173 RepID=A0ABR4LWJ9_9EURO